MPHVPGHAPALGGFRPQNPALAQQVPQTGLIGAEQALQQGLGGSVQALLQGAGIGRQDVARGFDRGLTALGNARTQATGSILGGLNQLNQAGQQVGTAIGQGVGVLNPFIDPGVQAQQQQAALAGLGGQEAFNQALIDSPAQRFLQEQGERAVTRNAAATGGLQGGNVLLELQRRGQGLAAQDLQNQFNRAGAITGQGLQAAGQVGQLRGQEAGIRSALGQAGAGLRGQEAGIFSNIGQAAGGLQAGRGQALGNIALGTGQNIGQALLGTGQQLAGGRTRAGEQIAGAVGGTTSALSNLINQQGTGLSDIIGQGGANLANLLSGAGQAQGTSQEQLAAILANLATGQGTQLAGLEGQAGQAQAQGILGQAQGFKGGVADVIKAILA